MEKFIPYGKLSKKEQRKRSNARRQTWGELNPVTRKPQNSKAYNRKKSQDWKRELPPKTCDFSFYGIDPARSGIARLLPPRITQKGRRKPPNINIISHLLFLVYPQFFQLFAAKFG